MAVKLDDFLTKKKEPAQVLDLSRVKITSREELRKYLDKIPEYKIKPEKVPPEAVRIRDKDFSFVPGRRELRKEHRGADHWNYPDPVPPDMKGVRLEDLCPVTIEWKMLTTLRPKTRVEEEMFSRLVHLGKLDLKYQQSLKRSKDTDWVRKTKNPRSSIVETRVLSCRDCGEDFCDGSQCNLLTYESCFRLQQSTVTGIVKDEGLLDAGDEEKEKKKRRKGRKKGRSIQRKLRKNSIFNRPASQGCNRDHAKRQRNAENRSQSQERARSRVMDEDKEHRTPRRSKSAPRCFLKRESEVTSHMEGRTVTWLSDYTSDSVHDSRSRSESESPIRRKSIRKTCLTKRARRRPSLNWHLRLGSGSDSADNDDNYRVYRPCRNQSSSDSENEGSCKESSEKLRRGPATIQIHFQPPENYHIPNISRQEKISQFIGGIPSYTKSQINDEKIISSSFSRIDLEYKGPQDNYPEVHSHKRSVKIQKPVKGFSPPIFVSSENILKGTALLQRPVSPLE